MQRISHSRMAWIPLALVIVGIAVILSVGATYTQSMDDDCAPDFVSTREWETDFCHSTVDFGDFLRGQYKDGIPSVANPEMESIEEASRWLTDRSPVIAVEIDGEARAYPQAILMWHEIANDELAGIPIAVTFCPLCNSSITFDRRVDGDTLSFGVSGLLRNSDMVMFDRETESWWQQLTGEGLIGHYAGALLDFVPSQVVSFKTFVERYPDGMVMSRNTGHSRRYGDNPYTQYDSRNSRPFLFNGELDDRLPPVAHVLAGTVGDVVKAYPFDILREEQVVNDTIGETAVVIFFQSGVASALDQSSIDSSRDIGTAGMYHATVEGQTLTFVANDDGTFTDEQTNSTWNAFGEAIEGDLAGTELEWIHAFPHFWFAWVAFQPDTLIYGM